jgi:hypothetical protein
MLEQRWIGRYSKASLDKEDSYLYLNRLRYLLRLQLPVYKQLYVAAYDEIFVGFGGNIGENIFDQNRFGALVGYTFSKNFRAEGGYLNQIVQLGREVGGKNVFRKTTASSFRAFSISICVKRIKNNQHRWDGCAWVNQAKNL